MKLRADRTTPYDHPASPKTRKGHRKQAQHDRQYIQKQTAKRLGISSANICTRQAGSPISATESLPPWPFGPLRLRVDLPKPHDYPAAPTTIGKHLKKVRMDRQLTQRQVANALGVRQTSVCEWEAGKLSPSVAVLPRIIRFLGYDPRPIPGTFGHRIVHLRGTHGLSQLALAKLLRVDTLTLRRWENDQHQPTKKLLKKLERIFPEHFGPS